MWSVVALFSVTTTVQVPAVPEPVVAPSPFEASLSAAVYTCIPSASVMVTVAVPPVNAALAWETEAEGVVIVQLYVSVSVTSARLDACQWNSSATLGNLHLIVWT